MLPSIIEMRTSSDNAIAMSATLHIIIIVVVVIFIANTTRLSIQGIDCDFVSSIADRRYNKMLAKTRWCTSMYTRLCIVAVIDVHCFFS